MEMLHEPEFWVAVGFLLVIALLLWKGVPGIVAKMLDQRAAVISAELEEAKRLRAEAAALLADYQKRAKGAEAEARSIVAAATEEAAQFAKESRAALEAQIARRAAAAQDKIAQAEAQALGEVRASAAELTVSAARIVLNQQMASKGDDLVAKAIEDVGAKLN